MDERLGNIEGKQDQTLEKQDETISIIKTGVDEMQAFREENKTILQDFHQDTIQRFDSVDVKYGRIREEHRANFGGIERRAEGIP